MNNKLNTTVGIIGWGIYVPSQRVDTVNLDCYRTFGKVTAHHLEVSRRRCSSLGVQQFAVPALSEDSTTMAIEASMQAIKTNAITSERIGAVYLGSESRGGYKVRPTSAIIANSLGVARKVWIKDIDAACAGGTVALEDCLEKVLLGKVDIGLAIGSDVALYPPGNAELTQGAGAAALLVGRGTGVRAQFLGSFCASVHSEDFFQRNGQSYPYLNPLCSKRVYVDLCREAIFGLLKQLNCSMYDFNRITFHTPYEGLALKLAKEGLGLMDEEIEKKVKPHLFAKFTGNTYAASSLISLVRALELSQGNENILLCSYGSGAIALAMAFKVLNQGKVAEKQTCDNVINETHILPIRTYEKWRKQYCGLRCSGGKLFTHVCRVLPKGEEKQNISICGKCGRLQGIAPRPVCAWDNCQDEMIQIHLPVRGQVIEIIQNDGHTDKNFCEGLIPLEVTDTGSCFVGQHVRLAIRVIEIEGEEGPICYGPAYIPDNSVT